MLAFMRGQAAITNQWAAQDRARSQTVFQPLEDKYIADAKRAMDPDTIKANADARAGEAVADVRQQFTLQREADRRRLTSMGVSPDSGRFVSADRSAGTAEALAAAGASNLGRRQSVAEDEAKAETMRTNVINLGRGLAVNPATSMGLSNNAGAAGFQGAMSGYGQQASILNADYQNRVATWQARQQNRAGVFGALGAVAGALPATAWTRMFPALGVAA